MYESRIKERASRIKDLQKQIEEAQTKQNQLTKQGEEQRTAMNQLQEKIRNYNSLSQKVQDKLSKLDPDIAVYTNKLENLRSQENEKKLQIDNNQKQTADLTQNCKI